MSSEKTRPSINRRLLSQGLVLVTVAGLGYGGYRLGTRFLATDPLKSYKDKQAGDMPETVAIQSQGSVFNHYDEGKPKASCNVRVMEIAQNKQVYNFQGISSGKLTWKDSVYGFAADRGTWNGFSKKLTMNGNLRLTGKKFNLNSDEMTYDEARRLFLVPKEIKGSAYGGKLQAVNFVYEIDSGNFKTGKGAWSGVLPEEVQDQAVPQSKSSTWTFEYEDFDNKGEVSVFSKARATDGEVIIRAPKIERNSKTDVVTATGRVLYFSPKANMIADKVVVYRKEKRAVLTGNVTMLVKPKEKENEPATEVELTPLPPAVPESISSTRPPAPDDDQSKKKEEEIRSMKNLRSYPMAITASSIEYWYKKGERRAKINGSPQGRQELPENGWRYVWAHHAFYDAEKDLLNLYSEKVEKGLRNVILKNSIGDEFYGNSGILSTKDGDDTYSFKDGKGKTTTNDDDVPKNGGTTGGSTGGGAGGGTGTDKGKGGGGGGISGPIGHKV